MSIVHTPGVLMGTFGAKGSLTLPADYYILGTVFKEDVAAITGLKIGTTDGGEQVVAAFTLPGTEKYTDKNPIENSRSFVVNQTLYIDAANWNGAETDICIIVQYLNT